MKLIYKTIINQTAIGTVVSSLSLAFNVTNLLAIIGLIVAFEFLETLIGLGLAKLWRRIKP